MLSPRKLFVQEIKEKIPRIIFFLLWILLLSLGSRNRGVGHVTPGPLWPPVLSSVKRDTMENQPGTDLSFFLKMCGNFAPGPIIGLVLTLFSEQAPLFLLSTRKQAGPRASLGRA